ncbi:unnamed protein product [Fraxinus pennsylvanica]|uniref:Cytochrome P450 n=1 Tax=Fraxinus pennsylvanica TaxID=56036 RepID=A0AAD2DLQ8_9LAMI|nr:unnamed protein product [Fraxinus pennsylvanica]
MYFVKAFVRVSVSLVKKSDIQPSAIPRPNLHGCCSTVIELQGLPLPIYLKEVKAAEERRLKNGGKKSGDKPPGPKGIPIFGNMFHLGDLPHQTMYHWGKTYGPLLWLNLGQVNTMIVQNATTAAELFKKHDVPFADRKVPDTLTAFNFNAGSLGMNTFGGHWRVLR